jgi:hypothetical protein
VYYNIILKIQPAINLSSLVFPLRTVAFKKAELEVLRSKSINTQK